MEEVFKRLQEISDNYKSKSITARDGKMATMYEAYAAGINRAITEIKNQRRVVQQAIEF